MSLDLNPIKHLTRQADNQGDKDFYLLLLKVNYLFFFCTKTYSFTKIKKVNTKDVDCLMEQQGNH